MQLPAEFKEKYTQLLGKSEAEQFFASFDQPATKGFRRNPLKPNYRDLSLDTSTPVAYCPDGFVGQVDGRTLEHQAGYVYSQDLSAMYVAQVTAAKPGEMVLDLCAAPGGKATQIAAMMHNQGVLVANEINGKRARILAENLERIGAHNVMITNESPERLAAKWPQRFDKIVVDAPCSGEGMFRKDHAAVQYWTPDYPASCAVRQRKILESALTMLKPGGELIYSTCTFAPEEDEQIVAWLLKKQPTLACAELKHYAGMDYGRPEFADGNPQLKKTVRLMMHHFNGEGHFIAKLKDSRTPEPVQQHKAKKKRKKRAAAATGLQRLTRDQLELWEILAKQLFEQGSPFAAANLRVSGNYLYYMPQRSLTELSLADLSYVRPGLLLGEFKKKRCEPSYALALALQDPAAVAHLDVTPAQWQEYVAGNALPAAEVTPATAKNGWYLLVCGGKPFAFGKLVNGTVKNFFPKGLRFSGKY